MSEDYDDKCAEIFEEIEEVSSKYQNYISELSIKWKTEKKENG